MRKGKIAGIWEKVLAADPLGWQARNEPNTIDFGSEIGRWCFAVGGAVIILGVPALPLIAVARARNGANIGPVGLQWLGVLFGYFIACLVWSMVLYSLLTGIIK